MTIAEILLQDYDMEMEMTRRTLERVPEGNAEYRCHAKSTGLGKLAMHVATLPGLGMMILSTPSLDLADPAMATKWPDMTFRTVEAMLATFDAGVGETRAALAKASDEELLTDWRFSFGANLISEGPRSVAFRHMCVNHMVHHRAQLGVYLRLNDVPVPGLYGPSADEPFPA
jgi:uncharacterized damage-inducible protein DinB